MNDIFISYARSTAPQANQVGEALRTLGYGVWRDDELPAHRAYADVIEERLRAAKAVVVIWSAEAVKSQWVRAEADLAREAGTLVQLRLDATTPPLPFNQIQCADMHGWTGDLNAPGWRKVVDSIGDLMGGARVAPASGEGDVPLPLPSKPSIAVMPFANLSGDPEQEYFADGMVDEVTNALSRFKSLLVIASASTLSFKGKAVSPQEVGRLLGVRYLLDGSVRRAGSRVRISVKLIDAADGAQVWSERFDDTLEDVFDLQDKVALSVAGKIEPTIQAADIRRAITRPTDSLGSYELSLRARALTRIRNKANTVAALELLDRAIALDPQYASALSTAAFCHTLIVLYGWSDDPETHRHRGIELARRALEAQGDDADTLAAVAGVVSGLERDDAAAVALIARALALNPGSSNVSAVGGILYLITGDLDAAVEHLETSMRLDPLSPARFVQLGNLGRARFHQGRHAEAARLLREATQQYGEPLYFVYLAAASAYLGDTGAAREALDRSRALAPQPIAAMVEATMHDPAQLKQLADGIALAEGNSPSDHLTGA